MARGLGAVTLALVMGASMVAPAADGAEGGSTSGQMTVPRSSQTATALGGGTVLIAGGSSNGGPLATAEIFDTATNTSTPTGDMATARWLHASVALSDGRVLTVGGENADGERLRSVEIFDLATEQWAAASSTANSYYNPKAVRLSDGRVLVAGGTAEIYDVGLDQWTPSALPAGLGSVNELVVLPDGRVFAIGGGYPDSPAAIFDPVTNGWLLVGSSRVASPEAAVLGDGRVLLHRYTPEGWPDTEIFDPASGSWSLVANPRIGRSRTHMVSLLDGRVALLGGQYDYSYTNTVEAFDSATGTWKFMARLDDDHDFGATAVLADGRVVIAGSGVSCEPLSDCPATKVEVFDPSGATAESVYLYWWQGTPNRSVGLTDEALLAPVVMDDATGWGITGRTVRFTVSGKNAGTTGQCRFSTPGCVTADDGVVYWSYRNADGEAGVDKVRVHVDDNGDAVVDPEEHTATATVTWRKYPTRIVAAPALVNRGKVQGALSARLTSSGFQGYGALPGHTIRFTNAFGEICRATTDSDGWARCAGVSAQLQGAVYEAVFDGNAEYEASSSRGLPLG